MNDVISSYKEQWQIGRSFRTIKSFIEIKPIYHRKSDRIRVDIFVCVLSLLLPRLIGKNITISYFTISKVLKILSSMKAIPVK